MSYYEHKKDNELSNEASTMLKNKNCQARLYFTQCEQRVRVQSDFRYRRRLRGHLIG